jgi:branched-chain amino acid transport system substrate-binding protein
MRPYFKKPFLLAALLTIIALVPTADAEPGKRKKPIRVGGTLSLTGKYADMGRVQEKGYRLWESETNAAGGLLGRPVKLVLTDDESDPAKVSSVYTDMLRKRSVDLAFTPYSSELTLPAADIFEKYRYPVLVAGAASEKVWEKPRKYTLGLYSTADRYFIGFLELCAINKKKTVSIVGFKDPFSSYASIGARKWAEKFGLKVVSYGILDGKEEKDLAAEADRIAPLRPDAVIITGYLKESIVFRKVLDRKNLDVAFAGSVGPSMHEFRNTLGPLAEGVFGASQWEPDERIPYLGSRSFIQAFRKQYGEDPSYHAANAYASVKMLAEAVEKTGSLDLEKIRMHIVTGEHKTVVGPFKLRKDGTQIGHRSIIIQWQNGRKEIVWPENMRTASPVFRK